MYAIIQNGDIRATTFAHKPALYQVDIQEMELIYSTRDVNFGEQDIYYTGLRYLHRMICLRLCLRVPSKGGINIGDIKSHKKFQVQQEDYFLNVHVTPL